MGKGFRVCLVCSVYPVYPVYSGCLSLSKSIQVLSTFLCKLLVSHFLEERQVLPHFPYRG